MSDVEKITSDIIQIISDLFSAVANVCEPNSYKTYPKLDKTLETSGIT